jgi:hypothetical protein
MIAKKVIMKNFGPYSEFEAEFSDGVTNIIGLNGAGKSTLIKSFLACMKGVSKNQGGLVGERYQFIGNNGKTAKLSWILRDEVEGFDVVVTNKISKNTNSITFEAPEGCNLGEGWLKDLFNVSLMSAKHFCSHSPKEQAGLLGINTDEFDDEIRDLKEEFTLLNRDHNNFGDLSVVPEEVEEVKVDKLAADLEELQEKKEDYEILKSNIANCKIDIENSREQIESLEDQLKNAKKNLADERKELDEMDREFQGVVDPSAEIEQTQRKIKDSQEINEKALVYTQWEEKVKEKDAAKKLVDKNKSDQKAAEKKKIDHLKTYDFPFSDMGIDDDGGLMLKGRHINGNGFSQGELELIVAKIIIRLNPQFRVRLIDDASLLDDKKNNSIVSQLLDDGFQVIMFYVGDQKRDKNSILLRECKIVDGDGGNKKKLLE